MARWYIFKVHWARGAPPFARNLRVANARLYKADGDAPPLTVNGFVFRWRNATLTAKDVYRILAESNAQPGAVIRWRCDCDDWHDCDAGLTKCGPRRAHANENKDDLRCVWVDEDYERFYAHNQPTRILKSKRNRRLHYGKDGSGSYGRRK